MKIFRTVQKIYAIVGISSTNQSSDLLFNKRVAFGSLLSGCTIISQSLYVFRVSNGFMEYMECICSTFASILIFIGFMVLVFNRTLLFESMNKIESFIDTSEW